MPEFTVEDQLKNLSDEQLDQMISEFQKKKQGDVAISASKGLLQGARGVLAVSQGRGLPEPSTGKREISPEQEIDTFEKKERIKAKIKQEFGGGSGGMQIVQLPGGGFAVIPGGTQSAEGVATDLSQQTDASGKPLEMEDVKIKSGGITGTLPKSEAQLGREISEEQQKGLSKGKVEALTKSVGAQRMAVQQTELIAKAARLISQVNIDAIREGGMGSLVNEFRGKAALFFGGEQAEKFSATETFPGLKTEIVARLMPTLTQQGDKPGSVRLVQTIFAKLELTLPGNKTPAKNARKMMSATLTNAFNFARAAHRLGLTNESVENLSDEELESFSQKVSDVARNINLAEVEQNALDLLLNNALAPYDEFILERGDREGALKERFGLE